MTKLVSLFIVLTVTVSAMAEERTKNEIAFTKFALEIPNQLITAGAQEVAGLKLKEWPELFEKTRLGVVPPLGPGTSFFAGSGIAMRSSATFMMQDRYILLMGEDWMETPREVKPLVALHENLSVNAVNDEHYQVSTAMWIVSRKLMRGSLLQGKEASTYLNQLLPKIEIRKEPPTYQVTRGGGATGVGGGGDSAAVEAKMIILDALESFGLKGKHLLEAERLVLQTKIEADPTGDYPGTKFDSALDAFIFSKLEWRKSQSRRNQIAHEILSKLKVI